MFIQFIANGLITGLLYSLISLAFALVYNTTRIFHIVFAALYVAPSYFFYTFFSSLNLNLFISFFLSVILNVLLCVVVDYLIYKPLEKRKTSKNIILISSLGASVVLINLIALIYGNETKIISNSVSPNFQYKDFLLTDIQIIQASSSILLIFIAYGILKFTRLGVQIRAIRDDIDLAYVLGLKINHIRYGIFGISGAFVAVASNLISLEVGIDPYVGMPMLLNAMVALIVGGIGRFESPILGGVVLGILQSGTNYFFENRWESLITFGILLFFLIIMPNGFLGEKSRKI